EAPPVADATAEAPPVADATAEALPVADATAEALPVADANAELGAGVSHAALSRAVASNAQKQFPSLQTYRDRSNKNVWEWFAKALDNGVNQIDILNEMNFYCSENIPLSWSIGPFCRYEWRGAANALPGVLKSLEAQFWHLEERRRTKEEQRTKFCKLVSFWFKDFSIPSYEFAISDALEKCTASTMTDLVKGSKVVSLVVAYAKHSTNDSHNAGVAKALASLVMNSEGVRSDIRTRLKDVMRSDAMYEVPEIVSRGLLSPLFKRSYLTAQSPPTPVDEFVFLLLMVGSRSPETSDELTWYKKCRQLWKEHLTCNPEECHRSDAEVCERVTLELLREIGEENDVHTLATSEWWAQHMPNDKTYAPVKIRSGLELAHQSITDPDSLTYRQHIRVTTNLAAVKLLMVASKKVAQKTKSTAPVSFEMIRAKYNECVKQYAVCKQFKERASSFDRWLKDVKRPIFEVDVPLCDFKFNYDSVLEPEGSINALYDVDPSWFNKVLHNEELLYDNKGQLLPLSEVLENAELHMTTNFKNMTVSEICKESRSWCAVQGIPRFPTWFESLDPLRKLLDQFGRENAAAIDCGDGRLLALLKGALDVKTGAGYKEYDQLFYRSSIPNGLNPRVLETVSRFISPECKNIRDFREKKIETLRRQIVRAGGQTTQTWSQKSNLKILAAIDTLVLMPRRQREDVDLYKLDEIVSSVTQMFLQSATMKDFLSVIDDNAVLQLDELIESFQARRPDDSNSTVSKRAASICANGVFVCQTVEDYDSVDGVAKSYRINLVSPSNQFVVVEKYSARQIGEMLSEARIASSGLPDEVQRFVSVVPTLLRFVEIGVDCLKRGYCEFVPYCESRLADFNKHRNDDDKLTIRHHQINGRASGFRFQVHVGKITDSEQFQLSEVIRNVALECDRHLTIVREAAANHPVLACFDAQEIGAIMAAADDSSIDVHQVIYRRLGRVAFKKHMLAEFDGKDLSSRIEGIAGLLTELCSVNSVADVPPTTWCIDDECQWPLAAVYAFKHAAAGPHRTIPVVDAHQICLPIGDGPALLASRDHFVNRVSSGMTPRNGSDVFCLVVPEQSTPDSRSWLTGVCNAKYPCKLFIIVHASHRGLSSMVPCPDLTPCLNFFDAVRYRGFCVVGPSRSGKMHAAKIDARELFHVSPTSQIVACSSFLSDTTHPHQLFEMVKSVGSRNAAIVEIGTGSSHHLQALVFSLMIGCWSSRDGTAVCREHPVVLKVHSDHRRRLPILELLHLKETTSTRLASSLADQFVRYAAQRSPQMDSNLLRDIGGKLECPTQLPVTRASWKALCRKEFVDIQERIELPEYLLTFHGDKPIVVCRDAELSQNVDKASFVHNGQLIEWLYTEDMTSDDLWTLAFELLGTPEDKRIIPKIVMTPSILQSLIRLDLSVKCRRQGDISFEDDGAVTFVGETGCGKTQLVDTYCRYSGLGLLSPRVINVTAGTTESDITTAVETYCTEFEHQSKLLQKPMVIFFDEFNTSAAQDIIKRIVLDRRLPGRTERLPSSRDGLLFIAACNPYEVLPGEGNILKYSVQAHISPSLERTCWRLPQPSAKEERDIIKAMCAKCDICDADTSYFVAIIPRIHGFLKNHSNVVPPSLRTVSRLLRIYRYLDRITCLDGIEGKACKHQALEEADSTLNPTDNTPGVADPTFAPLAIAVNYFVALPNDQRQKLQEEINSPPTTSNDEDIMIHSRIKQDSLQSGLNRFGVRLRPLFNERLAAADYAIPSKLHRASAFNESLAVTYLCVHTQTPLFLIGPPGSSKSLATLLVVWAKLHEKAQPNHLRRLDPLYFQCSKMTSSEAIREVMHNAKTQGSTQASFVHVFDEIGNADQADGRPLRSLNQYLERSVFRSDGTLEDVGVDSVLSHSAFLGTSNYYLDRSLLGRAVLLQRDNPSNREMDDLFSDPQGDSYAPPNVIRTIQKSLQQVTSLQGQQNIYQREKKHNNVLTMRDVFALVNLCGPTSQVTPELIVKALGRRGHKLIEKSSDFPEHRKKLDFTALQHKILQERLQHVTQELSETTPTPRNRMHPTATTTDQRPFYQSRQRPLMIETDLLSTVLAALDQAPLQLSKRTDIIYGRYLVKDDQMATQTMLQLRQAMVSADRICLLVDCESLFDNLLDVFNNFYQKDEDYSGELLTVRVVVDGRSETWRITNNFCARCIFVVLDPASEPDSFTPAVESRFEKVSIRGETLAKTTTSVATEYDDHQRKLGINGSHSTFADDCVVGYHPLMIPCPPKNKNEIARRLKQLTHSGIVLGFSRNSSPEERRKILDDVIEITELQKLSSVSNGGHRDDNKQSEQRLKLVMCPVGRRGDGTRSVSVGELQSINDTNELLAYVKEELSTGSKDVRTLTIRAATPDMLFLIAITNLLGVTQDVAAIGISHSDSNPLTESHLLAICHLIESIAKEHRTKYPSQQVLLFAPAVPALKLTIPRGWDVFFCEMVRPRQKKHSAVSRDLSGMEFAQKFFLNDASDCRHLFPSRRDTFQKYVDQSTVDVCFEYLTSSLHSMSRTTTSQAVAEVLMYRELVADWRWKLCMHYSNHTFFMRHQANVNAAGWTALPREKALQLPQGPVFLLSPCRDGSLPAGNCIANNNRNESKPNLASTNATFCAMRDLLKPVDTFLENRYYVAVARLCGAQSSAEIITLVEWHKESRNLQASTAGGAHAVLPLEFSKLACLRVVIAPRNMRDPRSRPAVSNVLKLLEATEEASDAAFLDICGDDVTLLNRVCFEPPPLGRYEDRMQRVKDSILEPPLERPTSKDLLIRLALVFGLNFAIEVQRHEEHLLNNAYQSLDELKKDPELVSVIDLVSPNKIAQERFSDLNCAFFALRRRFPSWNNTDLQGDSVIHPTDLLEDIAAFRNKIATKELADLPYIGHYAYLIRQLHELLFVPTPDGLRCVATLEMKETLTVDSIPKELRDYIIQLLGEVEATRSTNIFSILRNLLERLSRLIEANNRLLAESDDIIAEHSSERPSPKKRIHPNEPQVVTTTPDNRPKILWSYLTVHHQVISYSLINEVLLTPAAPLARLLHLEEVLVGLPIIMLNPNEFSEANYIFLKEPAPSELF
ncbi:Hypothetical protein, putative, partial [Bodo saltans]